MALIVLVLGDFIPKQRPKTSKSGGLPNFTHEPRKLVLLSTMLKNATEFESGMIAINDVVQHPEKQ